MAITLTHSFVSAKADGPDTTQVQPSDWNDAHTLTMATARLLGRTTAGTGAAEELSVGASLLLSAGVLSLATNPAVLGDLTVAGTVQVAGTAQITGALSVGGAANASAALDVQSTTKGALFPRMTTTQRDAIGSPATGLLIYNTTTDQLEVKRAAGWTPVTSGVAGDFVQLTGAQTVPGTKTFNIVRQPITTVAWASSVTLDFAAANKFYISLTGATMAMQNPSNVVAGQSVMIYLQQDATGGRLVTWGTSWKFPGGLAPVLSAAANSLDVIVGEVLNGTFIACGTVSDVR